MTVDREQVRRDAAEALELALRSVLDEDEACDAAMVVLAEQWNPPALLAELEQAERERDEALNLVGRIASGEGGGFNWAVRMAQEFSTERTERLVSERDAREQS